mgnify:CR=1 FL=1
MKRKITVDSSGKGDFLTIQDALKLPDEELYIILKPGIYQGQIFSTKKRIFIQGSGSEKTIITGKIGAKEPFPDGNITGTFRSYTAYFSGESLVLKDLTIENTAGQGTVAGQAVALYASAKFVHCKNVRLCSYQDTLFTAPLPEKERLPGGFRGPEEKLPRIPSVQFYENCYICGTIDFIFGSADSLFEHCTIGIHRTTTECYVTAPSTPKNATGYIFNCCKIEKCEENLFYNLKDEEHYIYYSCGYEAEFIDIPNLSFYSKVLNETFELSFEKLFTKYKHRFYFNIVFNKKTQKSWTLGQIFLNNYRFVFDAEQERIGYYKTIIPENHPFIALICIAIAFIIFFLLYLSGNKFIVGQDNIYNNQQMQKNLHQPSSEVNTNIKNNSTNAGEKKNKLSNKKTKKD